MSGGAERLNVPLAAACGSSLFRVLTWGVPALLPVAALIPDGEKTSLAQTLLLLLALVVSAWFWLAPRRLACTLTPDAVVVRRVLAQTRLPCAGLSVRRISGVLGFRPFGTGTPGYLTGQFTLSHDEKGVGRVLAAASTNTGGVLLRSGDAEYFLTPADPKAFLTGLARRGAGMSA